MSEQYKTVEDLFKEAEIQRIKAEISKLEEETFKIALERQELHRKINLPWYKKLQFYQAIAAGVLAIPLIWFYVQEFALPLIKSENVKLSLENEQTRLELSNAKKEFEKKLLAFQLERNIQLSEYITKLKEIQYEYTKLDSTKKFLAIQYQNLSSSYQITKTQEGYLKSRAAELQREINEKNLQIELLDSKIKEAEEEGKNVSIKPDSLDQEKSAEYAKQPAEFRVWQNFPNPFNSSTTIVFDIPTAVKVKLAVFNLRGELVRTLVDGKIPAGRHNITFDARGLSSGVYIYRLEAGAFMSVRKMILAK